MSGRDDKRGLLRELLHRGEVLSIEEVKSRLGLDSSRHVRRLVGELRAEGVPIIEEWEGGRKRFLIGERDRVTRAPLVAMSEGEILALAVAAEASRATLAPTPLGAPLRRAFDALLAELRTSVFSFDTEEESLHWHFGSASSVSIDPEIFGTLTSAIQEHRRVRIDYYAASSLKASHDRPIEPYGFAVRGGSWLLVARCLRRMEMRDFSLAGIGRVVLDDGYFLRPDDFDLDEYFRPRFSALAGGERFIVRLLVEPDRAPYFHRKSYHTTQSIERTFDDDRIIVRFEVMGLEEIRSFAQSWGVGLTVLEPPELVARMREESRALAGRYEPREADDTEA
jgi:predicted DNA-binding transcriptional regulator YafY